MVLFQIVQRFNALLQIAFTNKLFLSHTLIKFRQIFAVKYLLLIYYNSGADGIGLPGVQPLIDLNNVARSTTAPDAGAYESIMFPPD